MRAFTAARKLMWLALYFYAAPLVANIFLIIQYGHLLGDFPHIIFDNNYGFLLLAAVVYIFPLFFIILFFSIGSKGSAWFPQRGNANFMFYLLVFAAAFTISFGTIPVGESASPGMIGLIQTIIIKFNPYLLIILLVASRVATWKILLAALCVAFISLAQKSLLGYFVIAMSLLFYWVDNKVHNRFKMVFILVIPVISIAAFQEIISLIYDLRNQSRGVSGKIDENLLLSYALGRINSFSSLYQILYDDCCGAAPSAFYAIGTLLERLTGLGLFNSTTPGQSYNELLLGGGADYGIFTSTAGAAFISLKSSLLLSVVNFLTLLGILRLMYILLPIPNSPSRLPLFLIVLYFPYLSGDVWELSLIFQSILILRIANWLYWLSCYATNNGVTLRKKI